MFCFRSVRLPVASCGVVLALAIAAAGCGGGSGDSKSSTTTGSTASSVPSTAGTATTKPTTPGKPVPAELTIAVNSHASDGGTGGTDAVQLIKVMCPDTTGDHEAACNLLADTPDLFDPVPADTACTEIYGGPETATVRGTVDGKPVNVTFTRTNGCEIARYEKAQPLWKAPAAV